MRAPDLLICGESGAGKGSLAESLGDMPLVVLDCRVPPSVLVESVLFGYVRSNCFGPGGPIVKLGVLESAGTLVLDELAAIPTELHPKLARTLATRQLRRIGESVTRPVEALRVIATSAHPTALAPVLREQFVEQYVAPLGDRLGEVAPDLPRSLVARLAPLRLDLATVRRLAASPDPAAVIRELELLAAIAETTDDGPRLVYADVLLARGDVLGELIHVQCQLARSWTRRLAAHERRLLAAYGSAWLAPVLAVPHVTSAVLRRGFVEIVRGTADIVRARDVVRRVAPAMRELWADGALVPI